MRIFKENTYFNTLMIPRFEESIIYIFIYISKKSVFISNNIRRREQKKQFFQFNNNVNFLNQNFQQVYAYEYLK